ncbi:hypothetical protein EV130_11341 [Rhizobium azibense]|uniref:Uncharacterized protein n=1 Tax=Rhizobium azibense TaxID=1136135 RepID=A0A4R3QF29_9HYPH|nr:hypothetical protein RHECNPAF_4050023 [Rhizobium etli CNPAF512]TCU19619.1 hypothetical protein EV130_11341 [Rhizobium azibense]
MESFTRCAPAENSLNPLIGEFVTVLDGPVAFSSEEPGHTPQAPRPKVKECGAESAGTNR